MSLAPLAYTAAIAQAQLQFVAAAHNNYNIIVSFLAKFGDISPILYSSFFSSK